MPAQVAGEVPVFAGVLFGEQHRFAGAVIDGGECGDIAGIEVERRTIDVLAGCHINREVRDIAVVVVGDDAHIGITGLLELRSEFSGYELVHLFFRPHHRGVVVVVERLVLHAYAPNGNSPRRHSIEVLDEVVGIEVIVVRFERTVHIAVVPRGILFHPCGCCPRACKHLDVGIDRAYLLQDRYNGRQILLRDGEVRERLILAVSVGVVALAQVTRTDSHTHHGSMQSVSTEKFLQRCPPCVGRQLHEEFGTTLIEHPAETVDLLICLFGIERDAHRGSGT